MSMVVMHSEVPIDPAFREAAMELMAWMAAESRAENGVIDYRVTADIEDPNTLRIIEQYEDDEAARSHESSEHLDEFQERIGPCLADDATLYRFDVVEKTKQPGP